MKKPEYTAKQITLFIVLVLAFLWAMTFVTPQTKVYTPAEIVENLRAGSGED